MTTASVPAETQSSICEICFCSSVYPPASTSCILTPWRFASSATP